MDLLDNADDEMLEKLESLQNVDEDMKRRVFSMSEKKYEKLKDERYFTENAPVEGVETYRRPHWLSRAMAAAAALVLVGGGLGVYKLLDRNGRPDMQSEVSEERPPVTVQVSTQTTTETTTEAAEMTTTETASEGVQSATEVTTQAPEDHTAEKDENEQKNENTDQASPDQLTEDERHQIYNDLFGQYMTLDQKKHTALRSGEEMITIYMLDSEQSSAGIYPEYADKAVEHDGKVYMPINYYKVDNPEFTTLAEMRQVYSAFADQHYIDKIMGADVTGCGNNGFLDVVEANYPDQFVEYEGQVYSLDNEISALRLEDIPELDGKSFPVSSNYFFWESNYDGKFFEDWQGGYGFTTVDMVLRRQDDGSWKIYDLLMGQGDKAYYSPITDNEVPTLMANMYESFLTLANNN